VLFLWASLLITVAPKLVPLSVHHQEREQFYRASVDSDVRIVTATWLFEESSSDLRPGKVPCYPHDFPTTHLFIVSLLPKDGYRYQESLSHPIALASYVVSTSRPSAAKLVVLLNVSCLWFHRLPAPLCASQMP
jgi:hypothetical protein